MDKEKLKGKPALHPMDTQVDFSSCTTPESMKRAIEDGPDMTKGEMAQALEYSLRMMRTRQTRIEERDWHKLSKQLWQKLDKDFDQSEDDKEDSHRAAGAKEELDEMNAQSAIMGEMVGETIQTSWM